MRGRGVRGARAAAQLTRRGARRRDRRPMIGVALADDQPLVRSGLRMIVEGEPDLHVVGEAADGAAAVDLVAGAAARRTPAGRADAGRRRARGDGTDRRGRGPHTGADADDLRPRRVRLPCDARGRLGLPAQGHARRGHRHRDPPGRPRRRRAAGPGPHPPAGRPVRRRAAATGGRTPRPAHRPRGRGAAAAGPRAVQRRDRRGAVHRRDHGQDPRGPRADEARAARPGAGRDPRPRAGPGPSPAYFPSRGPSSRTGSRPASSSERAREAR